MKRMLRTHQLIKLKVETVQELKRLMSQTGQGSLDNLITKMIRITHAHRQGLKGIGWVIHSKR